MEFVYDEEDCVTHVQVEVLFDALKRLHRDVFLAEQWAEDAAVEQAFARARYAT